MGGIVNPSSGGLGDVVDDTTPQLGGDLDLNGFNIDFPTTANISDVLDEDNMASDSATALATQQSIKAYVDSSSGPFSTIGTSGDYADVQAMIDAGKYKGRLISNVTEGTDITVDANGLILDLDGFQLDMEANQFTHSAGGPVYIFGGDRSDGSELVFTRTTGKDFDPTATYDQDSSLVLRNLKIDHSGSSNGVYLFREVSVYPVWVDGCEFVAGNQIDAGITMSGTKHWVTNCVITGGGTSCRTGINITDGTVLNCVFEGTWDASFAIGIQAVTGASCNISNIVTSASMKMDLGGNCSNIREEAGTLNIDIAADQTTLANVKMAGNLDATGQQECFFTNIFAGGNLVMDAASDQQNSVSNSRFEGTLVSAGQLNKISNTYIGSTSSITGDYGCFTGNNFVGAVTVSSGAVRNVFDGNNIVGGITTSDQTIITNNKVGANAGGGAVTITIAAGSTDSIVSNNLTDAAISDSGTTTALSNNVVY